VLLQSGAAGISPDGTAIVGTVETDTGPVAFLWTDSSGMLTEVGFIDSRWPTSVALAVADGGNFVVGRGEENDQPEAFYRTGGGAVIGLGDLDGGQSASSATGVSAGGEVIVGTGHSDFGSEAFRFDNPGGSLDGLGFLPNGISSEALGVSADGGTIVGRSATFNAIDGEAFRWTEGGGMVGLGDLPGGQFKSVAYAASVFGGVIVGAGTTDVGTEAFRWSNGAMVSLGDFPGGAVDSVARAVSASGARIVGEGRTAAANSVAFIWDQVNGLRDVRSMLIDDFGLSTELEGWNLLSATGISGDGSVMVGRGINPDGEFEAWRAEIDSAPILPGDYNSNDTVDAADYTIWRNNLGSTMSLANDVTLGVGPDDYTRWKSYFGETTGSSALASASVPEPATGIMLLVAMATILVRGRSRLAKPFGP